MCMKKKVNIEIGKHIFIEMILIASIAIMGSMVFYISLVNGLI